MKNLNCATGFERADKHLTMGPLADCCRPTSFKRSKLLPGHVLLVVENSFGDSTRRGLVTSTLDGRKVSGAKGGGVGELKPAGISPLSRSLNWGPLSGRAEVLREVFSTIS